MPILYIWSSSGNGLVLTGGVTFTRQAYDKPDFSAIHRLTAGLSTLGNLRFSYDGTLRHMIGTWDFTYELLLDKHRRLNYFFGTGNNTTLDHDLLLADYYTLQYSSLQVKGGLKKTFWNRSNVAVGLILKGTGRENLEGNIFEEGAFPDVAGLERLRIVKGYLSCDLDFRDRIHLPQRGMRLMVENIAAAALNDDATNYLASKGWIEYFGTIKPFTLGIKVGGAVHDGMTPFFDLQYLGQNTDLRGYRQNRFTGKSIAFLNTDLRIQLVDNPKALIPYKLGVTLFYDMGRVFGEEEPANDIGWHMGYGAGIYFVPLRERFTLQVSMGFSDEESGLFRFGFGQAF
jgi:outer membrane protein assembly factor BamA